MCEIVISCKLHEIKLLSISLTNNMIIFFKDGEIYHYIYLFTNYYCQKTIIVIHRTHNHKISQFDITYIIIQIKISHRCSN
jgi:hypothetical protein